MEVRMQKLIAGLLIAGAIFKTDPVLVTRVTDGDTIAVQSIGRVSLLGIEARSDRARERLESLVALRWVRLEFESSADGRTNRHRAYVLLDTGEFVNATLVREGLARVARGRFARRGELERAEADARRYRRGIWARYTATRL